MYRAPGNAGAGGVKLPRATSRPMFAVDLVHVGVLPRLAVQPEVLGVDGP